jgi:serine/threonine-protein kinase PRP4
LRANDIFLRSGEKEMDIINLINKNVFKIIFNNSKDPNDRRHIIRLLDHFEYRKHLCIVFEQMDRDLRDTLKMFGRRIGLSIEAVKSYSK